MRAHRISPTLVVAIAALFFALTGTAAAVSNRVLITGSGSQASVTKAQQLLTTEAAPQQFVDHYSLVVNGVCFKAYTVPAGQTLVLRSLLSTISLAGAATTGGDGLYLDSNCFRYTGLGHITSQRSDSFNATLDPGYVFSSGTTLYTRGSAASGGVLLSGYLITAP